MLEILSKKLDPNEVHGHDMISMCMLKLYGDSIWKPKPRLAMETRAIFSDIFKAFGLIYKLIQYGFTGNLLTLLTDFLSNRKQRVILLVNIPHGQTLEQVFLKFPS